MTEDAQSYLNKHGVAAALAQAVADILRERPANPLLSIGNALQTEATKIARGYVYVVVNLEILANKWDDFQAVMNGSLGMPVTVKQPGARLFMPCVAKDKNENGNYLVTIFEQWSQQEDFSNYLGIPERAPDSPTMKTLGSCLGPEGLVPVISDALDWPSCHRFLQGEGMAAIVRVELEILADKWGDFMAAMAGSLGTPITVKQPGARIFMPCVAKDKNENGNYSVIIFEQWDKHEDFGAYLGIPERAPNSPMMAALRECLGPKGLVPVMCDPLDWHACHKFL